MFSLKDKVALVTGAMRGMGKSHAITLASQGAKIVVTDINLKDCEAVAKEIVQNGGSALAVKLDVTKKKEVDVAVKKTVQKFGRLDILVNNAGIFSPKMALEMTEKEWDATLNINLKGQFLCAQRAAREMMKNKWGRIINIASIASGGVGIGFASAAHYAASKGGIIGMSETLAAEWAASGLTVNVIGPGAIDTPMIAGLDAGATKEVLIRVPMKRIGRPEEISAMVVFLASEEASYVTGATFYVDGGWLSA
jgi:NAD(P)-dependent dehydrogenase (short-subunit alcohol dehydrogenase family)